MGEAGGNMILQETGFRVEKDFLGEKEIRDDQYYGIQTTRAIENFPITGYTLHNSLIISMAMVKKAAALSNMEIGQLHPQIGNAIVSAAEEIIDGKLHDQFIVDPIQGGAGTSINMNTNEVIANRALELIGEPKGSYHIISPNTHVNMSQSTNDSFPTAIRIATLKILDELLITMDHMYKTFQKKAKEFDHVIKMGRTHLQDAVPIRLGQEFEAYSRVIKRDIQRIQETKENLYEINMGATAIGTALNANPEYIKLVVKFLRDISELPLKNAENLVDSTQNTDAYTEVSSALKVCMINMSKIANDIRLMASGPKTGLNEIFLPARQPGSSIMPGKVNPVMAEVVNQVAFQVIGNDHTISLASEAGQLNLNVMQPVLVFNLIQSITMMNNAFQVFTNYCIEGIKANEEKLKENVEQSIGIITALNPHIGYELASEIAREALSTGQSVREICLQKNILTEDEINQILDPYKMTYNGASPSVL